MRINLPSRRRAQPIQAVEMASAGQGLGGVTVVNHSDGHQPFRRRSTMGLVAAIFAVLLAVTFAAPAQALSGSGYNNTLSYQQPGCGQGAQVISSKAILGGTVSMVYSPNCQTNWLEWYGPSRYTSKKMYLPVATSFENDTAGWSYSRQVYAPGTTIARGEIIVRDATNTWSQWWSVRCGSGCTWELVN